MNVSNNKTASSKNEPEWKGKSGCANASFKEVLSSDEHEDGKAQRILSAMAFLAATGGLIFAELNRAEIALSLKFPLPPHQAYVSTTFFAFIVTMVFGTLFFLSALGPSFNISPVSRRHSEKEDRWRPKSLLFSQLILDGTQAEWEEHWKKSSVASLELELARNYVNEAYLLSQKVKFKVTNMKWGKFIYKVSLGFLCMLVIPLLTTSVGQVNALAACVFASVFFQDLLECAKSPGNQLFHARWSWGFVWTLIEFAATISLIIAAIINWIR